MEWSECDAYARRRLRIRATRPPRRPGRARSAWLRRAAWRLWALRARWTRWSRLRRTRLLRPRRPMGRAGPGRTQGKGAAWRRARLDPGPAQGPVDARLRDDPGDRRAQWRGVEAQPGFGLPHAPAAGGRGSDHQ